MRFHFFALGLVFILAACDIPKNQLIKGKITLGTATNPKVGVQVFGEANSEDGLLSAMSTELDKMKSTLQVPLTTISKPAGNGDYSVELSSNSSYAAYFVYVWDDKNNDDKINDAASATPNQQDTAYTFIKRGFAGFRWMKGSDYLSISDSYDYHF
jgi:hypothetical protein